MALLYPPLLVTVNLWRKSTNPHGWMYVLWCDPRNTCIVGNVGCLVSWCWSLPNKYKFIRYGLTNKLFINSYIMLLIMREWFCLNAFWKVKRSLWWKEVYDKKKSCFLKIRVFEVLYALKIKLLIKVHVYVKKL